MKHRHLAVVLTAAVLTLTACAKTENGNATAPPSSAAEAEAKPRLVSDGAPAGEMSADSGDFVKYTPESSPEEKAAAMEWVALGKAKIVDLDPVVVNGNGIVLYRYDEDTAEPSKSNCTGDCLETWIPVLIAPEGTIYLTDIPESEVGTVEREDGTLQVTLGGQPIYRHIRDTKIGERNGLGVDDAWFGVRPDGGKATPESSGADISISLYPEPNFEGDIQGTSGPGCQNLPDPGIASSLELSGGEATLWSEEDCEGESVAVKGKVEDLSTLDFDDKPASVEFGS
jgi:predicted lipoprotein with Yx(FWY)xxD motif